MHDRRAGGAADDATDLVADGDRELWAVLDELPHRSGRAGELLRAAA
jgi:hypothetical protein